MMRKFFGVFLLLVVTLISNRAIAQNSDNIMVASDSEFVMSVIRDHGEIVVNVQFDDSMVFDYITIERKVFSDPQYSQCKYLTYKDVKAAKMKVKAKDTYPLPASSDVLYRLKIFTPEGIIRMFPPVRLGALEGGGTTPKKVAGQTPAPKPIE